MALRMLKSCAFAGAFVACLAAGPALAQQVTLRAGTFLPAVDKSWYPFIAEFMDEVNDAGKAVGLNVRMVAAGPAAMSPFEMGAAVQGGVLDLVHLAGTFYNTLVPLADSNKLSEVPAREMRANGAYALLDRVHRERMNVHFLGRWIEDVHFHLYLNKKVERLDLAGIRIRGTSVYQPVVEALGGTLVTIPPGDAYSAIERGVVDGYGWPLWGIQAWGWEKITRYRLDPGFYTADIAVLVNLDTWNRLTDAQRGVLTKVMVALENRFGANVAELNERERKLHAEAGIQPIALSPEDGKKLIEIARDAGWEDLIRKDPANGPKLRPLITRN